MKFVCDAKAIFVVAVCAVLWAVVVEGGCLGKLVTGVSNEWNDGLTVTFKVFNMEDGLVPGTIIELEFEKPCSCYRAYGVQARFRRRGRYLKLRTTIFEGGFALICRKSQDGDGRRECAPKAYRINGDHCTDAGISRRSCESLGWGTGRGEFGVPEVCAASAPRHADPDVCFPRSATYREAFQACAAHGARLCRIKELMNDEAKFSGCGYDSERVWSRTSCQGATGHRTVAGSREFIRSFPRKCVPDWDRYAVRCCADTDSVVRLNQDEFVLQSDSESIVEAIPLFDLKINCGGGRAEEFVAEDPAFFDRPTFSYGLPVGTQSLDAIFATSRYARNEDLIYQIPVTTGMYNVTLGFAELYPKAQAPGERIFDIEVSSTGTDDVRNYSGMDVFAEAGLGTVERSFLNVVVVDKLHIRLRKIKNNPSINKIVVTSGTTPSAAVTPTPEATRVDEVRVDATIKHQTIEGIGASVAWYADWLLAHPNRNFIMDKVFGDTKVSILRLRNEYDRDGYVANIPNHTAVLLQEAEARMGYRPLILMTSWSPPLHLKENNDLRGNGLGATVKRGVDKRYLYREFAAYWMDSLAKYRENGIEPTWISPQNEPDFEPAWEGCAFDPEESDIHAGYNKAIDALFKQFRFVPSAPKVLGPEVTGLGLDSLENYVRKLRNVKQVHALAHHLYGDQFSGDDGGYWMDPDSYVKKMKEIRELSERLAVPVYQTEMARLSGRDDDDPIRLGWIMHNAFVIEGVAMYLHWDLFWGADDATLVRIEAPWDSSHWSDPSKGYTIYQTFYAFQQFSRFVRPGWRRVACTVERAGLKVSAYENPINGSEVTVIVVNISFESRTVTVAGTPILDAEVYMTDRKDHKMSKLENLSPGDDLVIPQLTIVTLVYGVNTRF